jgi:hypothetical protein
MKWFLRSFSTSSFDNEDAARDCRLEMATVKAVNPNARVGKISFPDIEIILMSVVFQ